jgi:hemoglobin
VQTLFERHGGFPKVSRIVSSLYDRVLDDPMLGPFFEGVDMRRQIDHQTKFIAYLMGGPASFTDEHLTHVHARFSIDDAAFARLTSILRETLEDQEMAETDIGEVIAAFQSKKSLVVTQ